MSAAQAGPGATRLPLGARRLLAPEPGWQVRADVLVIGSGIAGLTAALKARRVGKVLLVTKTELGAGSTQWAQGGIASAMDPGDSPAEHRADTLVAGGGLCDARAVDLLVQAGPALVRELGDLGTAFDTGQDGQWELGREGGHGRRRIAHAGGDATGAEITRALLAAVHAASDIEIIEQALVLDLLCTQEGRACGVTLHVIGAGARDGVGAALARAVVLATGGLGQVFATTTNPDVSTGDGVALALRARAEISDLEFVQFHPTVLWLGPGSRGRQPLISEAARGEGAVLRDASGVSVMAGVHPLADLAPRDVVARALMQRMQQQQVDHLWLDMTGLGGNLLEKRFPTILASCRAHGIDPVRDLVPVAPAAHYASGGVRTDRAGRSSIPGLYACGEVSCTGVHGANRLASNSLLEGLVFADAIAADIASFLPPFAEPESLTGRSALLDPAERDRLAAIMSNLVGVRRDEAGMAAAAESIGALAGAQSGPDVQSWEMTNLATVATALTAAARLRAESRGSHWRSDRPDPDPRWRSHIHIGLTADPVATISLSTVPERSHPWS